VTAAIEIGSQLPAASFSGAAGVARRDITAPVGIRARQWGPSDWSTAEGVHRPLTLTAIALRGAPDAEPVFLLALDAGWWRRVDDEWSVRGRVLDALSLDPARLLISLSHTHAGPVLCTADADLEGGAHIPAYLDHIADAAIGACRDALASLQPALVEWATGHCDLASNRDVDLDGRTLVGFNPATSADDTVLVGRVSTPTGAPLATIVNYACHPTTLAWQNRLLSPDYVGATRELVEAATGAPCAFLQGASGDLAPREQYTGDVAVADRHGSALGYAVLAALQAMPPAGASLVLTDVVESGAPLAVWQPRPYAPDQTLLVRQSGVEMRLQQLPTIAELERQWADIDPRSREERLRRARNLRDGYVTGPTVTHPFWAARIGGALLFAHPGEAYSYLQRALRNRFPGVPVVVMNLTNGPGFVYVPTKSAYEHGAYPAWQSALAAGSLERLESRAVEVLQDLLEEER